MHDVRILRIYRCENGGWLVTDGARTNEATTLLAAVGSRKDLLAFLATLLSAPKRDTVPAGERTGEGP